MRKDVLTDLCHFAFCKHGRGLQRNRIYVFRPSIAFVSPKASVCVKEKFECNRQWDMHRIIQNKTAGSLYVAPDATLTVGRASCYAGSRITVNEGASLQIGSCFFNYDSIVECFDRIEIGEDCAFSERVTLRDSHNHRIVREGFRVKAPIRIGNHVWVGVGATVLGGVTIGDGAVIAAGAVVTQDVPAHTLVAGVPARVVRENVEWER